MNKERDRIAGDPQTQQDLFAHQNSWLGMGAMGVMGGGVYSAGTLAAIALVTVVLVLTGVISAPYAYPALLTAAFGGLATVSWLVVQVTHGRYRARHHARGQLPDDVELDEDERQQAMRFFRRSRP